ncbi:MAG: hypothetical protein KJ985_12235 [Proteobacteria bacterium]|nr:hypothetical protein [Pseudomonadota bacterium]
MNIMSVANVRFLSFSGAAILLFLVLSLPGNCRAELVDRVVAVVNDDVITMSEVNEQGKAKWPHPRKTKNAHWQLT